MAKFSNSVLAEKFSQGATKGEGSNMFIKGDTIYSYGEHFPIAKRLNVDQAFSTSVKYVLNSEGYSPTTGKHKSQVSCCLQSYIELPNCNLDESYLRDYVVKLFQEIEEVRTKQNALKTKGKKFQQYVT